MINETLFILYVKDQQRARDFYAATLDLQPSLDVPGMTEFTLPGGAKLGLMENERIATILSPALPSPSSANGIPRCELYLYTEHPSAYISRALNAGALPVSPLEKRNWGDTAGYVADKDGHVIAFAQKAG